MIQQLITLVHCWLLPCISAARSTETIIGRWADEANPDKQIQMVWRLNGKIYGKAIGTAQSTKTERIIFNDLMWNDKAKRYTGVLINPENGHAFTLSITLPHPDQFEFVVKRFLLSRIFRFVRTK